MKTVKSRNLLFIWILAIFLTPCLLYADDQRSVPLDLYLIIDATEGVREAKNEITAWLNSEIIDRLLQEGDRVVIWSAGPTAQIIHTETVGAQKNEIKDKIQNLEISGTRADFLGALREAASRETRENPGGNRISYTLLISSSAANLAPALAGGSAGLLRWFRAEKYAGWQALVAAPNIATRVREAAAAYMSGR